MSDHVKTPWWKKSYRSVRRAITDMGDERVLTHAAALAFYTALSLPPLLVVLVQALGMIDANGEAALREQALALVGEDGGRLVDSVLSSADRGAKGGLSGLVGGAALLFAATGVFAQLQSALNRIWGVESKPGAGPLGWIRSRLLSVGLIGVLAFLLLVSLGASAAVGKFGLAPDARVVARAGNFVLSLGTFTVLFAAVFRLLPDVRMRWRDVWGGAAVTALLFSIGKSAIGLYLARKGLADDYGQAGSAIVVLVWVYFSAVILLFGGELTQAWLRESGRTLAPNEHAVAIEGKG